MIGDTVIFSPSEYDEFLRPSYSPAVLSRKRFESARNFFYTGSVMLYTLRGKVTGTGDGFIVLECQGVGYRVFVNDRTLASLAGAS
ncbi:MAG: OB-fold domain-containing protein, partial [Patescibacteria group bacterium]